MRTVNHPVSTRPGVSHRRSLAPRTAFVLGGGGSLAAIQVGMLRGLYERGVNRRTTARACPRRRVPFLDQHARSSAA
jgi:hypothetical protein